MLVEWMNAGWWMCSSNEWPMEMNVSKLFFYILLTLWTVLVIRAR